MFNGRTDAKAEAPVPWPPDAKSWLIGKDPDAGKDGGQEEKGKTEDEMVGWHHWLNWCEFKQTQGDSEGQGSLVCYGSWGRNIEHDWATEQQQFKNVKPCTQALVSDLSSDPEQAVVWILLSHIFFIGK